MSEMPAAVAATATAASPPPASSSSSSPPPPYTRTAQPNRPIPDITILLLGSPGVGKSTFISALPRVRDGRLHNAKNEPSVSTAISPPPSNVPNPSSFSVMLFNRPYNIVIHRSESTLFIDPFPSAISFVIFCYSVDSRESLYNCQYYWRKQVADRYERELGLTVPIMLVGLRRDLRTDETRTTEGLASVAEAGGREVSASNPIQGGQETSERRKEYVCVMPHEGLKAAQEMACDKYAECSALTGELMWETLEDITRTAALTTTSHGGLTQSECNTM